MKGLDVDLHALDALKTLTREQMAAAFLFAVATAQTMIQQYDGSTKAERKDFDVVEQAKKILRHGRKI